MTSGYSSRLVADALAHWVAHHLAPACRVVGVEPAGGDSAKLEADARAVLAAWLAAGAPGPKEK